MGDWAKRYLKVPLYAMANITTQTGLHKPWRTQVRQYTQCTVESGRESGQRIARVSLRTQGV